ncbi:MAG: hypothetical protein ACR2FU_23650 [Streptosporangiaceae bacterium]
MNTSIAVARTGLAGSDGHGLAVAALVSWLVAEVLGAWMLRRWILAGGASRAPGRGDGTSAPIVFCHAGLALAGLTTWVVFLVTWSATPAWLAIGFLAPAIGLGVSTVTTWTPYPVRPPPAPPVAPRPADDDDTLRRALASETLTGQLIDDLLARMLAEPDQAARPRSRLAPLIPVLHGVAAIVTFLLTVLAAIAAIGS